jgi:hypothetical protein
MKYIVFAVCPKKDANILERRGLTEAEASNLVQVLEERFPGIIAFKESELNYKIRNALIALPLLVKYNRFCKEHLSILGY